MRPPEQKTMPSMDPLIPQDISREKNKNLHLFHDVAIGFQSFFFSNLRQGVLMIALVGIWVIFSFLTDGTFISPRNLSNLLIQSCITATLTMGMVLVIVTGYIDLSVGAVLGFLGTFMAVILSKDAIPLPLVLALTAALGILVGLWHGFWIAYQKVPAFIVTLASMLVFRGAIIGLSEGRTLSVDSFVDAGAIQFFEILGNGYLPTWGLHLSIGGISLHGSTVALGSLAVLGVIIKWVYDRKRIPAQRSVRLVFVALVLAAFVGILSLYQGIPWMLLMVVCLGLVVSFISERTVFGRRLYAIGGQPESAQYSGIDQKKYTLYLFALMGFLVAVAGVLTVARLSAATTSAGQNAELDAIAAAVIGGTSLMGGQGSIGGALIGALMMTTLDNGMSLMNLDSTFQYVVKGLILLFAVWFDLKSKTSV